MIPGVFVETPAFERERQTLWTDEEFQAFQNFLMRNPEAGDVVPDTGGLRKVRFTQSSRGKGKREARGLFTFGNNRDINSGWFRCFQKMTNSTYRHTIAKHFARFW